MALPEELPFSCCDTVPVPSVVPSTGLASSVSFGGLEEGGEEDRVYEEHGEEKMRKN